MNDQDAAPKPRVVDGFLNDVTCRQITSELRFVWWQDSVVVNRGRSGHGVSFRSQTRNSLTAHEEYFPAKLMDLWATIETRLHERHGLDPLRLERWQAVRYPQGGHFNLHHDGGLFGDEPAGERRTTVLIYLSTPTRGGKTEFPELGWVVAARAGRLVLWDNLDVDGRPDLRLRHRATPVLSGHKTVLTTWERERRLRPMPVTPTIEGVTS